MSKHTAGPWQAGRPDMGTIVDGVESKWIYAADDQYVAVASGRVKGDWDEVMANAHLIAAAPELLEALIMVRDAEEDCKRDGLPTMPSAARSTIDAAIAKAEAL